MFASSYVSWILFQTLCRMHRHIKQTAYSFSILYHFKRELSVHDIDSGNAGVILCTTSNLVRINSHTHEVFIFVMMLS